VNHLCIAGGHGIDAKFRVAMNSVITPLSWSNGNVEAYLNVIIYVTINGKQQTKRGMQMEQAMQSIDFAYKTRGKRQNNKH
jgi:hypothetical protein